MTTKPEITDALLFDALNAAALVIQKHFNQTDGGVGGVFFTGDNLDRFNAVMRDYAETEALYWEPTLDFETSCAEIATRAGYEAISTGGGCWAFSKNLTDETYIMISAGDSIGEDPDAREWIVGRHGRDGGFVDIDTLMTLQEALDLAPRVPSPLQGEHFVEQVFNTIWDAETHIASLKA